jgi:O-methyltransferase
MNWKAVVKRAIPPGVLNQMLLRFPALYRTRLVYYETTLQDEHGADELLSELGQVLHLEGDIVECGSSRCGASAIMADLLRRKGVRKQIYAMDSYEGFDRAELRKERAAGLTRVSERAFTSTSLDYVRNKMRALRVNHIVVPIKGYFQDTLPRLSGTFCFGLIDCDLRDSLVYSADAIWPRLVRGGRLVFDDYTSRDFRGARQGIDFFVEQRRREIAQHGLLHRLYTVTKK